ncbi:MAG TPA: hypothetical protein VNI83_02275 [Vicinamibacterales bacterium]|nr:hypothetical protein [Vicinamibacterales bacterium]
MTIVFVPRIEGEPRPVAHCIYCGSPVSVRSINDKTQWAFPDRCRPCAMRLAHERATAEREGWRLLCGPPGALTLRWRDRADKVLRELFLAPDGTRREPPPTAAEIRDAYPFGMRKYTPYKVWLEQVKRWQSGGPLRKPDAIKRISVPPEQGALL